MTHGTVTSIKCPYCKSYFSPRGCGVRDPVGAEIDEREMPCPMCKKPVYLWLRWSVTVEAEKREKVQ